MDVRKVIVVFFDRLTMTTVFDYLSKGVTFISQLGALPVAFMAEIFTLRTSGMFNQ